MTSTFQILCQSLLRSQNGIFMNARTSRQPRVSQTRFTCVLSPLPLLPRCVYKLALSCKPWTEGCYALRKTIKTILAMLISLSACSPGQAGSNRQAELPIFYLYVICTEPVSSECFNTECTVRTACFFLKCYEITRLHKQQQMHLP